MGTKRLPCVVPDGAIALRAAVSRFIVISPESAERNRCAISSTWAAFSGTNSRRKCRIAGSYPGVEVRAGLLSFGAEDGVAATDIRHERMSAARRIAKLDAVFFAGASAVFVCRTGR